MNETMERHFPTGRIIITLLICILLVYILRSSTSPQMCTPQPKLDSSLPVSSATIVRYIDHHLLTIHLKADIIHSVYLRSNGRTTSKIPL